MPANRLPRGARRGTRHTPGTLAGSDVARVGDSVIHLSANPNRGKRHGARLVDTTTPVTIGTDGVAREGSARRVYSPLTIHTPRRNERGNPIRRAGSATHTSYTV